MKPQGTRTPFSATLGERPGCFFQVEIQSAIFAIVPAFADPRSAGVARWVCVAFGIPVAMGCFWAIAQFNWRVLRRIVYDASGIPIRRSESAKAWLALCTMAILALPCYELGHLIVGASVTFFRRR